MTNELKEHAHSDIFQTLYSDSFALEKLQYAIHIILQEGLNTLWGTQHRQHFNGSIQTFSLADQQLFR